MPGLFVESSTLHKEASKLRDSVEMLGQEKREIAMLTQDARDMAAHSRKIRADAETLRKQHMEMVGKVWEKVAQDTVDSAWLKAATDKLASVRLKLAASCVPSPNSG